MAATCKGMAERPFTGLLLIVPGLVFIAVGLLILIAPVILVWLVAATSMLVGFAMLLLAGFMRRAGARFRSTHQRAL
jgi:hypothetical protein